MAGIYIHIPFCKQACHYCDFHFSTNFRNVTQLVSALAKELELQANYLNQEPIETIYFGGGTPSSISVLEIDKLIKHIYKLHPIIENPEITLEANPDDLTTENLLAWKKSGVNRLSVGVQSFYDEHLVWMNRAHNQTEAIEGLKKAKEIGITNITMDLIYGIPGMTMEQWKTNIQTFLELDLPHLSAYGLTIEPNTHLGHLAKTNQVTASIDSNYNEQFEMLMNVLDVNGFTHYEISNWGKSGMFSKHNTSYWLGKKYMGIGPSAHSFNGVERQWNVASNAKYIKAISQNELPQEVEKLSVTDQFNEYILTHLRTSWGIDSNQIKNQFGASFQNNLHISIKPYIASGHVVEKQKTYVLTKAGKYIADKISSDLFIVP